jgi:hypothetical protein
MWMAMGARRKIYGLHIDPGLHAAHIENLQIRIKKMVIFYVYMRERAKKSPFYVAYTQIGNILIGNLRMRRKKLRKPSYTYMRIHYRAKEITASRVAPREAQLVQTPGLCTLFYQSRISKFQSQLLLEKMEYLFFYIHVEPYIGAFPKT